MCRYLTTLCISFMLVLSACEQEVEERQIYVALPSPPVKIINTSDKWLVYDLHVKAPYLESVEIFNGGEKMVTYSDFITVDDAHIATIWLSYPEQGWQVTELTHKFVYKDASELVKEYEFILPIKQHYPDPTPIEFPVPSGIWYAEGAPGSNSYHTRALFPFSEPKYDEQQQGYLFGNNPQRYAIDYALLVDGLPYENDGSQLEDWYCYGLPILAARGGTVIYTKDGIPDNQTPFELDYTTGLDNATGNVVYIEHEDGTIGNYSHMIPNSILVKKGDTVYAGQQVGRLGNSGNSFAPHLHMHVLVPSEGNEIESYSDGLFMESAPYCLTEFTKLGSLPTGYLDEEDLAPFTPSVSEKHTDVLPSENDVIEY